MKLRARNVEVIFVVVQNNTFEFCNYSQPQPPHWPVNLTLVLHSMLLKVSCAQDQCLLYAQQLLWMRKFLNDIHLFYRLDLLLHHVFPIPLINVRHTPDRDNGKVNTRESTNNVQPCAIPNQLRYPREGQDITYDAHTGCETNQGTSPEQRYGEESLLAHREWVATIEEQQRDEKEECDKGPDHHHRCCIDGT
jgi:hypothetical protein